MAQPPRVSEREGVHAGGKVAAGGRRRRSPPLGRLKQRVSPQLIDDLRRELEYLQCFKLEMEHPGKGKGLSEQNAKTREMEMEHEVRRLKQVGDAANLISTGRREIGPSRTIK